MHWALKGFLGKMIIDIIGKGSQGRNSPSKWPEGQKLRNFRKELHERLWALGLGHQNKTTWAPTARLHMSADTGKQPREGATCSQVRRKEAGLAMRLESETRLATPTYSQQGLTTASAGWGRAKEREESGFSVRLLGCLGKII